MRSHDRWVLMLTCVYRCGFVMQRAGMRTCGHGAERMAHCMPAKHGAYCWHACVLHAHRGAQCKQSWRSHRPWQCPRARLASRCAGHTALWVPGGSCRLLLRLVSLGATSAAHRPPKPPHVRPPQLPLRLRHSARGDVNQLSAPGCAIGIRAAPNPSSTTAVGVHPLITVQAPPRTTTASNSDGAVRAFKPAPRQAACKRLLAQK